MCERDVRAGLNAGDSECSRVKYRHRALAHEGRKAEERTKTDDTDAISSGSKRLPVSDADMLLVSATRCGASRMRTSRINELAKDAHEVFAHPTCCRSASSPSRSKLLLDYLPRALSHQSEMGCHELQCRTHRTVRIRDSGIIHDSIGTMVTNDTMRKNTSLMHTDVSRG